MIHVHQLDGCSPSPLAHYLKALGILRLVSEQTDTDARGWWDGNHFKLATKLTCDELERFFLYDYEPTLLVFPWRNCARFFSDKNPGLSSLEDSTSRRFAGFRSGIEDGRSQFESLLPLPKSLRARSPGIEDGRSQLESLSKAHKKIRDIEAEAKKNGGNESNSARLNDAKKRFDLLEADRIPKFRLNWRGAHREWMDAAMVLGDDGTPKYPALLGTGGNDGRFDFANNFMKRIGEVFDLSSDDGRPRSVAPAWISGALWGQPVPGNLRGKPIGQYLPGTAGGANNGNGPDSDSMVNPVDFILMLEGTIAFTSNASRRFGLSESSHAASPFVVDACGAAYASASTHDERNKKGKQGGEQWMPLWSRPLSYGELRRLLAEGRAQVGVKAAREPLDLARAVRRLGTARGIKAFERYGYIERNGQANLAVPLGRFDVAERQSERLACIDDLDSWLRRLRREARDRNAPSRLVTVEKRLVDSLFAVAGHPQSSECWQRVLVHLAEVEGIMVHGSGFGAQPVPRLRPEWVAVSYDNTPEFRLALTFALQARGFRREQGTPVDPVRQHWLPLDRKRPSRFAVTGTGSATRLDISPEVVMRGRRGLDDAIALVERCLVEASQRESRHLPLKAAPRAAASIADLTALLAGDVDLDRSLTLARALMALNRRAWAERYIPMELPRASGWPDDAWLAIRLCALPWPLETRSGFKLDIGADPVIFRRLAAGDAGTAIELALRRLRAAGVCCTMRTGTTPPETARRWAAALSFPITQRTAKQFLYRLDPNKE